MLLRALRRRVRDALLRPFAGFFPAGDEPAPPLTGLHRVLLVQTNDRLGNTLLATPGVGALVAALAGASIDLLGGPAAPAIFEGYGLRRVLVAGRAELRRPWRLVRIVRGLRRERYDAAIQLGSSARSVGAALVGLSGARHRIGFCGRRRNVFYTSALEPPTSRHKVDQALESLRRLGIDATGERKLPLAAWERAEAAARLAERFGRPDGPAPVALFVGGRAAKRKGWPLESFAALCTALRGQGTPLVVLLGPEERARAARIRAALGDALYIEEPNLRRVAALLASCELVVSPDSGPMHLAVAVGTPTVGIFRKAGADRWGPRGARGEAVLDPAGTDVAAVRAAVERLRDAALRRAPAPPRVA